MIASSGRNNTMQDLRAQLGRAPQACWRLTENRRKRRRPCCLLRPDLLVGALSHLEDETAPIGNVSVLEPAFRIGLAVPRHRLHIGLVSTVSYSFNHKLFAVAHLNAGAVE